MTNQWEQQVHQHQGKVRPQTCVYTCIDTVVSCFTVGTESNEEIIGADKGKKKREKLRRKRRTNDEYSTDDGTYIH